MIKYKIVISDSATTYEETKCDLVYKSKNDKYVYKTEDDDVFILSHERCAYDRLEIPQVCDIMSKSGFIFFTLYTTEATGSKILKEYAAKYMSEKYGRLANIEFNLFDEKPENEIEYKEQIYAEMEEQEQIIIFFGKKTKRR